MNQLKVHLQQSIVALHGQGWSNRKIARELGLDRSTVSKYLRAEVSKPAIPLTGSESVLEAKSANSHTGFQGVAESKPAIVHIGSHAGRKSMCEVWRAQIEPRVQAGLSAQRIYQDLVIEHQ